MSEEIKTRFRVVSAQIKEDGKLLEVEFRDSTSTVTHYKWQLCADRWLNGCFAEHKLAEFQEALSNAVKILEGRR